MSFWSSIVGEVTGARQSAPPADHDAHEAAGTSSQARGGAPSALAGMLGPSLADVGPGMLTGFLDWWGKDAKPKMPEPYRPDPEELRQRDLQRRAQELRALVEAQKAAEAAKKAAEVDAEAKTDPQFAKDPAGARARAAEYLDAKHEIGGMFEVVDNKKVPAKDRKQNQVTDQEFRALAKRYEDIKHDRGDLKIEAPSGAAQGAKDDFKSKSLRDIARIMQTKSGRGLIDNLSDNHDKKGVHHTTTINLGSGFDPGLTEPASSAGPHRSNIEYQPGKKADASVAKDYESWAHLMRSDVVLYHELTHAYHDSHGGGAGGRDRENQVVGLGAFGPGGKKEAPFNENKYRNERNDITPSGRYNDVDLSDADKAQYKDWEDWWSDGKMKQRTKYAPDADIPTASH